MRKSKSPIDVVMFLVTWLLSTVAFIILKILGLISWSWWWLLVPLFGPLVLAILSVGTVALCAIFVFNTSKPQRP